jgi:hypothetical protein
MLYNIPEREVQFYRCGDWGTEMGKELPRITELLKSSDSFCTHVFCLPETVCLTPMYFPLQGRVLWETIVQCEEPYSLSETALSRETAISCN